MTEQQQTIVCAWCNRVIEIQATQPVAIRDKNEECTGETRVCNDCIEVEKGQ